MKQLRIIIIAFILITVGIFIWITIKNDASPMLFERMMVTDQRIVFLVLLISVFILLSTLSGLPVFHLSMALGFLLKLIPALIINWVVNIVAVMATFYLVRYAFSDYFHDKYGKKKLIRRINKRIRKYGLWTVAFSRGIYIIPTTFINFSFPLSRITPRSYLFGTMVGLLPEVGISVVTGYLIKHGMNKLSDPATRTWQIVIIGGLILLLSMVIIQFRLRQNRIKRFKRLKAVPYKN